MDRLTSYFNGDSMAIDTWKSKYQMKDYQSNPVEETPSDMHLRMAKEFARIEFSYIEREGLNSNIINLSSFGQKLKQKRVHQSEKDITDELFSYFNNFSSIVPQGSIMSNLGNKYVFGSLSNCFGIAPPEDSYGGIMRADQELVQLMKRRGGVGTHLSNLRPAKAAVSNAAKTSSGTCSFAERYSNSTREVAQEGRRGALMLLLSVKHPEIFNWVKMKADRTKITGANISVMFTDQFMKAVEEDQDFICRFPIDSDINFQADYSRYEYNKMYHEYNSVMDLYFMKIKAREVFTEFINQAWDNAEPGAAYIDTVVNYSPDGVYEAYCPEVCNPCGEQWFHRDETCRLIALNFWNIVINHFNNDASIDYDKLYEIAYMQQRLGDDLVDLEIEYIDRIINKIIDDSQDIETKSVELNVWKKIRTIAKNGRRTGGGLTGLGDMVAALGLKYGSTAANIVVKSVMKTKMRAELDATIDMAITRGAFFGWDRDKEFSEMATFHGPYEYLGYNDFYKMLADEFPEQTERMYRHGRRNVNWSTVAPTGTVSLMTQTTSGIEPLFKAYYIRRKKINPNDKGTRIDFTDQSGDKWQEYAILHPKFKVWIEQTSLFNAMKQDALGVEIHGNTPDGFLTLNQRKIRPQIAEDLPKEMIEEFFKNSPWFGSEADNIHYIERIELQSIVQRYTSNAISSTINLPSNVSKEVVSEIYMRAWEKGLKGVTVYRDGSRTGVLVDQKKLTTMNKFGYTDAVKRPIEIPADYHFVMSNGRNYAVIVGMMDGNPYELFAFENPLVTKPLKGTITKVDKGQYKFSSYHYDIDNIQLSGDHTDIKLLTRMVSMLLRHGAEPKFVVDQVEKSEVHVVSFGKAISRVLKTYIIDEVANNETCSNCGNETIVYQEGCKRCVSCGHSVC